jgi:hypothetical protein
MQDQISIHAAVTDAAVAAAAVCCDGAACLHKLALLRNDAVQPNELCVCE